jgi:PIN domain nuclease of toxin-antitoxin system
LKLLLDTHALIWWLSADAQLSRNAAASIADPDNEVVVSVASALECAIKVQSGKLPEAAYLVANFAAEMQTEGFDLIDIKLEHALAAGALPRHHGDPFDRMLIAQALHGEMILVSNEAAFDAYVAKRLW